MYSFGWIVLLATVIGIFCSVGGVDDVSTWVLEFADGVAWGEIFWPVPLPPPMQDFVFRPVSIALMKGALLLSSTDVWIPHWMVGLKAGLFSAVFGLASFLWLQQYTTQRSALFLSSVCMLVEPALFSATNFSEFDGLGAGFILLFSWLFDRNVTWWWYALLGLLIVFLKESCLFIWLCFMLPQLWECWRQSRWDSQLKKVSLVMGGCIGLWLIGTSAILGGKVQSVAGGLGVLERLPVLLFTVWQFFALWTEGGVLLVLWIALPKWRKFAFWMWLCMALWQPMMEINHYETRYFSRPWYVSILTLAMVLLWVKWAFMPSKPEDGDSSQRSFHRLMGLRSILLLGLFVAVILTSSNLREDLAARLFLSLLPGMLLLSWNALKEGLQSEARFASLLFAAMQWTTLVLNTGNWSQRVYFEDATQAHWTEKMVRELVSTEVLHSPSSQEIAVVLTDSSRRYSKRKIKALFTEKNLLQEGQIDRIHFETLCYFLSITGEELPRALQTCFAPDATSMHRLNGLYVVHRGRHVLLEAAQLDWLRREFSWIRGGEGRGAHMPINLGDGRCSERSLLEDRYDFLYTLPDPTEARLEVGFSKVQQLEVHYYQLPNRLLDIPIRLLAGVPILEPRRFFQSVWQPKNLTEKSIPKDTMQRHTPKFNATDVLPRKRP